MAHVAQLRFVSTCFAKQPRLRIRLGLVSLVPPLLASEIDAGVARVVRRRLGLILRLKALLARPRLDQRAVHREVLLRQEPLLPGLLQDGIEEAHVDLAAQKPRTVLRVHRRIPHAVVHSQAHEPAVEDVEVELLHQLPLAADRVQHLQYRSSDQLLRRNRRPADARVQPLKHRRHLLQRRVDQHADRTQRVILRHPLRGRDVAEHSCVLVQLSAHPDPLFPFGDPTMQRAIQSQPFSAACYTSKAIVRPSGDQRGDPWLRPGPRVSRVGFDPSASASQISSLSSARPDTKAIRRPSGEYCGSSPWMSTR